jgi:O-antigen/teichoic acid export membrane protein
MKELLQRLRNPDGEASYFARGGFWLIAGYAVQVVLGLALAAILANLLSKDSYGTYQFIISAGAIVGAFTLTGMGGALIPAVSRGNYGVLRYAVRKQFIWSAAIVAACVAAALYYYLRGNQTLAELMILLGLFQPVTTTFALFRQYQYGRGRYRESTFLDTGIRVLTFLALIVALFFTRNIVYIVLAFLGTQALSTCLAYVFIVYRNKLPYIEDAPTYEYAKHLSVMESLSELAAVADKFLVWLFLGAAPLATYALAQLPIMHLQSIFGFSRPLAFPRLAQMDLAQIRMTLPQKMRVFFLVSLGAVAAYIIIAPVFYKLVFPTYPEAVRYSQVLSLVVLAVPRTLISQAFYAHHRTRELYIINVSTPFVRTGLLALGVWQFGLAGAVGALLLSELYMAILQVYFFNRIRAA